MPTRLSSLAYVTVTLLVSLPRVARADPWFGMGDNALEDQFIDGDLSAEDLVEGTRVARSRMGSQAVRSGTWLSVSTFAREVFGRPDVGLMLIVNAAFDRVAEGEQHHLTDRAWLAAGSVAAPSFADGQSPARPVTPVVVVLPAPPPPPPSLAITPAVAREAVVAAWRASGIGVDDARIDSMIARARQSAALPETRLRVMKVIDDSSQVGVIPTDTSTYDVAGANLYFEARLTWRLDRLLYADDEPTLERSRLERQDARERISAKVIDTLFQWQRADIAARVAAPGSKEQIDASLRMAEAEAALDVLTSGWFGGWLARRTGTPG